MKSVSLVALVLLLAHVGVSAQMLRCTDVAGKTTYTDQPCPGARSIKRVSITDNTTDSTELRARAQEVRSSIVPQVVYGSSGGVPEGDRPGTDAECAKAKRAYAMAAGSISPKPDVVESWRQQAAITCTGRPAAPVQVVQAEPNRPQKKRPSPEHLRSVKGGFETSDGQFCPATRWGGECPDGRMVWSNGWTN
jgi:malic enzyme